METRALTEFLVFLAATSVLVPAFRKARLSAVMAFLVIGVLIGPFGLGALIESLPWLEELTLRESSSTHLLAELGVVFLLFAIGLEVSPERLWALRRYVLGFGLAQVVLTALVVTVVASFWGHSWATSCVIGLGFALSSTAVVLQLLGEKRQLSGPTGRAGFSVLLMQDLAVIPILFVVGALSADSTGPEDLLLAVASAAGAIVAIFVIGKFVLSPLFRWAGSIDSREVFVATALLAVVGAAAAAHEAGLSMALGAFLAGLLLAETEFRHQVEADIEPFKGLLLGLFFVVVGMQIDLALLLSEPFRILIGVLGLFVVKGAIIAPLARLFGLPWRNAIELAFLLGQTGEFAFVVVTLARDGGVMPGATADYMLLVVGLSIFVTPLVAELGARLASRLSDKSESVSVEDLTELEQHVVIAGFGRVGQALAEILQQHSVPHVVLETDAETVSRMRKRAWPVLFGDASRRDVLERVGADRASAIVVTIDNPAAVERVVAQAKAVWPNVPIYARARDAAQAKLLHAAGASLASPENLEATLQLGEALLQGLGMPDEAARRIIEERRVLERAKTLNDSESESA